MQRRISKSMWNRKRRVKKISWKVPYVEACIWPRISIEKWGLSFFQSVFPFVYRKTIVEDGKKGKALPFEVMGTCLVWRKVLFVVLRKIEERKRKRGASIYLEKEMRIFLKSSTKWKHFKRSEYWLLIIWNEGK